MKAFKTALKIVFVLGLLYYLARNGFISFDKTRDALLHWRIMGPALAVMGLNVLCGVVRWQWLLRAQGTRLSWLRVFQLTFIGNFFNLALPGAVTGDLVKAFYVGKETTGKSGHAFGSILFDRVAGLSALVLVAAGAMALGLCGFGDFGGSPLFKALASVVVASACAVIGFFCYLFLVREEHDPLLTALRRLGARFPKTLLLANVYGGLRHYHSHRLTVLKVLALSVCIHLMVGWCAMQFVLALGGPQASAMISPIAIYVIVPLGLLVTAVPVAPAGVGTGHVAFAYLFGLVGFQQGADVFTLYALSSIIYGAVGGLIFLRYKSREAAPVFAPETMPLA